ncbi:MAG: hypothetical protein QOJ73_6565 [Streptosporangiaceae bacterium]|jgi:hypothetical protein|nr:hypothetical protein [Streptosporangiaceae bacterium]
MALPSILFLPEHHYDYRIWNGIPSSLSDHCQVVLYDRHEPMPWAELAGPAFLGAVRRLAPGQCFDVVAAAGEAARLAFSVASGGLAKGVVFFQPFPDRHLEEVTVDLPAQEVVEAAAWIAPVLGALHQPDPARRRELVVEAWRDRYGPHLAAGDLELACQVIGDHTEELLASVKDVAAAAEAGEDMSWPSPPWIDRLGEIDIPVTAVVSKLALGLGQAVARRAREGHVIEAQAYTDLVWLEDRVTAVTALRHMLDRLS